MCRLKRRTCPSVLLICLMSSATIEGSPSVASPSVMFITIGGKQLGCVASQSEIIAFACARAWHIGVPPLATGSTHTGNLIFCSTIPPAPSSTFLVRSSTRQGELPISLILTRRLPLKGPEYAGSTPCCP